MKNKHISKKTPCFVLAKEVNIWQNQMNLRDSFCNWVATHAQTIQNIYAHLVCLEMRVARLNFDLILLAISYVVWLKLPLPRYNNRKLKIAWNWMKTRPGTDRPTQIGQLISHSRRFLIRQLSVILLAFKAPFFVWAYKAIAVVLAVMIKIHHLSDLFFSTVFFIN